MSESRVWHLVIYDIRESSRYRKAYKVIRGYGSRVQYSVFRVRGTRAHIERLRWELERILEEDDELLIVPLCSRCLDKMRFRNRESSWSEEDHLFKIIGGSE